MEKRIRLELHEILMAKVKHFKTAFAIDDVRVKQGTCRDFPVPPPTTRQTTTTTTTTIDPRVESRDHHLNRYSQSPLLNSASIR